MTLVSRLARRAALLLALPALAACGTLRMYEGPERPPEEVARIEEDLDTWALAPLDFTSVEILAVDGVSIADHSEGTVEVLPGRHTLAVAGTLRVPSAQLYEYPHGTIAFDARPGGDYEFAVTLPGQGGHAPAIIVLLDSNTGDSLGDTSPPVELAQTATIDFAGPPWPVADWGRTDNLANMTFLPPGQTLDDWQEMVETQAYLPADPDSLEDPVNRHVTITTEGWEDGDPTIGWTEHPAAAGWRILEYHAAAGADRQREEHGLVMVGSREGRVHVLIYAARSSDVLQANLTRWQGAFERAELTLPAY